MDGVFMRKILKRLLFCTLLTVFCWSCTILANRHQLSHELIRFHVLANSNSSADQQIKLQVRDAVLESIQNDLQNISDISEARSYLQDSIQKIELVANRILEELNIDQKAQVSFCRESYDTRCYNTFTLPAGIYDSLRIVIGDGNGENWWCVAFPTLCMPATSEGFEAVAADAGLSDTLVSTLSDRKNHHFRFFLLDAIGKVENMVFPG